MIAENGHIEDTTDCNINSGIELYVGVPFSAKRASVEGKTIYVERLILFNS
jgi:hypothetical protein